MRLFEFHPTHPNPRCVRQLLTILNAGGVVAFPTDSAYALICALGQKEAIDRIRQIRQLDKHHNFSLFCKDLSHLGQFARVNNGQFRWLKAHLPGPYTVILEATKSVPKRLQHPKRKTIGLRVPVHIGLGALLSLADDALMGVSLILPGDELPMYDASSITNHLGSLIDAVVDAPVGSLYPTTVIDLTCDEPIIIRHGQGD